MDAYGFWEGLGDLILWPAGNDQLELLQAVGQSPTLERTQEALVIIHPR